MRDYAKVAPHFWIGATGKRIRSYGPEAQVVALYLVSSPHANMIGLYHMPLAYLSADTGLPIEGATKALECLIEAGFCGYDKGAEVVWVYEMARYQIGEQLKPGDKQCLGTQNTYNAVPGNSFLSAFYEKYRTAFNLSTCRSSVGGIEGPSHGSSQAPTKPLRSQEQEQEREQEQEQDQEQERHSSSEKRAHAQSPVVAIPLPQSPQGSFPMTLEWKPSDRFPDFLQRAGIPRDYSWIEDLFDFQLYRMGRGEHMSQLAWEQKFLADCKRNFDYRPAEPTTLPDGWWPGQELADHFENSGLDLTLIYGVLLEQFRIANTESGAKSRSWNGKFMEFIRQRSLQTSRSRSA